MENENGSVFIHFIIFIASLTLSKTRCCLLLTFTNISCEIIIPLNYHLLPHTLAVLFFNNYIVIERLDEILPCHELLKAWCSQTLHLSQVATETTSQWYQNISAIACLCLQLYQYCLLVSVQWSVENCMTTAVLSTFIINSVIVKFKVSEEFIPVLMTFP